MSIRLAYRQSLENLLRYLQWCKCADSAIYGECLDTIDRLLEFEPP